MSPFTFLCAEFPTIYESANKAASAVHPDPRTACFYARRALELTVNWLYKYDNSLNLPYQDNLSTLIHEPTFKTLVGETVFNKARVIIKLGNQAVHSPNPISVNDAIIAVRELFHVTYWLAHTYGRSSKPDPGLTFNPDALPKPGSLSVAEGNRISATLRERRLSSEVETSRTELQKLETQLHERDENLSTLLADKNALDEELKQLRAEIATVKQASTSQPDTHDYSEAQTRDIFIDLLLKEVGWSLVSACLDYARQPTLNQHHSPRSLRSLSVVEGNDVEGNSLNVSREFEVTGMPNESGRGFVDYVLWGDDGKPLGLVEAKRTRHDPRIGQQQAKLYADRLEAQFGQRPVIFYSNGYDHWLWEDTNYPPRKVQGFYKKTELELLIQRRTTRKSLAKASINPTIVERYYQTRAVRRVSETFETDKDRKALLVMATGAGKTRTAIALVDLLMRCNWVKRVLFLADRVALVNQAINVFKKHLPDAAPVNLVTEKDTEGRVFASTYPTMMGLIDETREGQRRFGVGHFDLIIIDEAHRSVFQKYRTIFDYFDSLLLGLTATPKDEIDRNTYGLFDLENGVPTDAYQLEDAVNDGFLVPSKAVLVPLKFQREGINYNELSETERDAWDALEWDEDGGNTPERIEAEAVNRWLFNKDTVDKVLEHLMIRGLKVAGGDRLGKTIIFAKNQDHANFIADRFNINYPHLRGEFARVITFKTTYAQTLIDSFSNKDKDPHIAISVDMLDTGIDVPEVVNLVLFKLIRSKTKFWQMVGRGTRRCPDLFGLGQDKQFFYLFDYCQNLEFFQQNPETIEAPIGKSLSKQLFTTRLDLIAELDNCLRLVGEPVEPRSGSRDNQRAVSVVEPRSATVEGSFEEPKTDVQLRQQVAALLHIEVAAMNNENFIVRPKRRSIEKYANSEKWHSLSSEDLSELSQEIAGLPSQLELEAEETKRFDLLMLKLQLALLRSEPAFERLKEQVKLLAELLEEKSAIPLVREQLPLIEDVQTDEWWQDVTLSMLEVLRQRLRGLVKLVEKQKRLPIYTDFEDEMGEEVIVDLPGFVSSDNFEKFRAKARVFLREHQDHVVIFKLRTNKQLTSADLLELERILAENGVGEMEDIVRAKEESKGLGLFVRSLVGLDREVAKQELGRFLSGKNLNSNQIEFVDMIVNYLTEHGVMDASLLYESPFTDITPQGPDELFTSLQVDELIALLEEVYERAVA